MNKVVRILLLAYFSTSTMGICQTNKPNWVVNTDAFEQGMDVTIQMFFGTTAITSGGMVGAFIDGSLVGVKDGGKLSPNYKWIFTTRVFGNSANGKLINFKFYDTSMDRVFEIEESIVFESDAIVGSAFVPRKLYFFLSTNATLADLKIDNTTLSGFNSAILDYKVELPFGTAVVPTVSFTASDIRANIAISPAADIPGTTTIVVTAENGTTQKTYSVNFFFYKNKPNWTVNVAEYLYDGEIIAQVLIDKVVSTSDEGILAAFVGTSCRGIKQGGSTGPGGKYGMTLRVYTNETLGETLTFQYFDPVLDSVFPILETVPFEINFQIGDALDPYPMHAITIPTAIKPLVAGWNWISLNLLNTDMSLGKVLANLNPQEGDYIKNQTISATFYSGTGWFGDLKTIVPKELYKVKITTDDTIKFKGYPVDPALLPLALNKGWNWIGYLPQLAETVTEALASISPLADDYIKSQTKSATFYEGSGWFGEINVLEPLDGYMLKTGKPGILYYPAKSGAATATVNTNSVTDITQTTAKTGGNITSDGGSDVSARGVCWSIGEHPTLSASNTLNGNGTGSFTSSLIGLTANTTYYVRAYAINLAGTGYGNLVSFKTSPVLPKVTTSPINNILQTTATGGGEVTDNGGAAITARGICWNTKSNPTITNFSKEEGSGTGIFSTDIAGLSSNTTYFVKAYATNLAGTAYGAEIRFRTILGSDDAGTLTDPRDFAIYNWIKIGTQIWMAENLAYLPSVSSPAIGSTTVPYYYVYEYTGGNVFDAKLTGNYNAYGVLYNWAAAKTACPFGWHLPTDAEWTTITNYLANSGYGYQGSGSDIGKSLAATSGWTVNATAGTIGNDQSTNNDSGFSALPGGYRNLPSAFGSLGTHAYFWSLTGSGTLNAITRYLLYSSSEVTGYNHDIGYGFSVRCVRD